MLGQRMEVGKRAQETAVSTLGGVWKSQVQEKEMKGRSELVEGRTAMHFLGMDGVLFCGLEKK